MRLKIRLSKIREAKTQWASVRASAAGHKVPEEDGKAFPALAKERPWVCNFTETVENNREILVCLQIGVAEPSGKPGSEGANN